MDRIRINFLTSALLVLIPTALNAQREAGSITGLVTDSSQAAVPGARIVVTDLATGVERNAISNGVGLYVITALPASRYSVSVEREGFTSQRIPELVLQVGQAATVNMALTVGSVAEAVTVTATAVAVETREGSLSTEIHQKMITDLPLNGRNVLQLLAVTPGTLNAASSAFNQAATRPESSTELVSVSGGRGNSTAFTLDGGLHEDPYTEVANVVPNPDAIQEFSYQTNSYSAKFGGRGGGSSTSSRVPERTSSTAPCGSTCGTAN